MKKHDNKNVMDQHTETQRKGVDRKQETTDNI